MPVKAEIPLCPETVSTKAAESKAQLSLLLVDDDRELCGMMKEFFTEAGHRLDCEHDGLRGFAAAISGTYDLVILDVMMPHQDGFTTLQQVRRLNNLPVIILTARVQHQDRILGLNAGADDYLLKPFDPDELLARINAVLRRTDVGRIKQVSEIHIANIRLNAITREVRVAGDPVGLTQMEFDLLELLMRSAGRVVTRDEIAWALLKRAAMAYDRILDVHVSNLRKKLEAGRTLIRTIRGVGYVFSGTV